MCFRLLIWCKCQFLWDVNKLLDLYFRLLGTQILIFLYSRPLIQYHHLLGKKPRERGVWASPGPVLLRARVGGQWQLWHLQRLQTHLGRQAEGACYGAQSGLVSGHPARLWRPRRDSDWGKLMQCPFTTGLCQKRLITWIVAILCVVIESSLTSRDPAVLEAGIWL